VSSLAWMAGWLVAPLPAQDEPAFAQLFDGVTLSGWSNPFAWGEARVADGTIELRSDRKFFLVSERSFGDFVLEAEVRIEAGGNSGIQFRSRFDAQKLWGLQAEVDGSGRRWSGGLYDEGRRGWLEPLEGRPERQAAFRPAEWNRYRIECRGAQVRIHVNGVLTADAFDAADLDGHVALQHHGEPGQVVRFRGVRIADLGRSAWLPLFDRATLTGWRARPGGSWRVEAGRLIGTSSADEARHGLLVSEDLVDDFTARVRFRAVRGNSGFYFRCEEVEDAVGVHGFQAEIDPAADVGGLYETGGRGWVARPGSAELAKHLAPAGDGSDGWNDLEVSASGRRTVVRLNGWKSAELADDPGRLRGRLALQLHGGMEMRVEFERVELLARDVAPPALDAAERARREQQLALATAVLERAPQDVDAWIWRGRRLGYVGRWHEAIADFSQALARFPDDPRPWRHRGHRWITLRAFPAAERDLARAAALIADRPDEIEPAGLPNERGIAVDTLHHSVWYHLGLARHLQGDHEGALAAWRECLRVSANPDALCSATHWCWGTLMRIGDADGARRLLEPIGPDLDVVEYHDYQRLCLLEQGRLDADELLASAAAAGEETVSFATVGYGVGTWHLVHGRRERALEILRRVSGRGPAAAFGTIAAEVELGRR